MTAPLTLPGTTTDLLITHPHEAIGLLEVLVGDKKLLKVTPSAGVCLAEIQLAKKTSLSCFVLMNGTPYESWREDWMNDFSRKLGEFEAVPPETSGSGWEAVQRFKRSDLWLGITHLQIGATAVVFWIVGKDGVLDPMVLDFLRAARARVEAPDVIGQIKARGARAKPSPTGPLVAAAILGVMAIINFAMGEKGIYALRGRVEIPGMVSGVVLAAMAAGACFRRVKLTYYFMLFSVMWSLLALFMGNGSLLYLALETVFVVGVAMRHRDFGYHSVSSFLNGIASS